MPFDFEPALSEPPPLPLCSTRQRPSPPTSFPQRSDTATTFHFFRRHFTNVSFPTPLLAVATHQMGKRHPSPSIGEFQFISWFLSHASYPTRHSPFRDVDSRNLQRDAASLHSFHNFFPKRNCSIEKKTSRILFFTLRNIFHRYLLWILVSLYTFCIRILKFFPPKILPY